MAEGSGQRYCGNCGTQIRSGINFCVSCGKPVSGGAASPGPDDPVPPPTPSRSLADTLKETFQGLTERFSNARFASGGASLGGLPNKAIHWFKDLPSVPKLVIVGLALLLLLTILSPVARVVAIVVFVVSAIVLAVRAIQRKPLRGWIIAVIGSVVLIPVFGGISGAIYGSGFTSFVAADRESSGGTQQGESGQSESLTDSSSQRQAEARPTASHMPYLDDRWDEGKNPMLDRSKGTSMYVLVDSDMEGTPVHVDVTDASDDKRFNARTPYYAEIEPRDEFGNVGAYSVAAYNTILKMPSCNCTSTSTVRYPAGHPRRIKPRILALATSA